MAPVNLTVALNFASGQYSGVQNINLGSALKTALTNAPDYWLQGPLATQARVDVRLAPNGPMHLTADVTAYADGSIQADVHFNNDLTTIIPGASYQNPGAIAPNLYSAVVMLNGRFEELSFDHAISVSGLAYGSCHQWSGAVFCR